jgi:hypothetical protein
VKAPEKEQTGKRTETTATQRNGVFTAARLYSPHGAPSIPFRRIAQRNSGGGLPTGRFLDLRLNDEGAGEDFLKARIASCLALNRFVDEMSITGSDFDGSAAGRKSIYYG